MVKFIGVDIETQGLEAKYNLDCKITGIGFYGETIQEALPWDSEGREMLESILDEGYTPVFHNAAFDVAVLRLNGIDIREFEDTMCMSYCLHPDSNDNHSLAFLAPLVDEEKGDSGGVWDEWTDQIAVYCLQDTKITWKLFEFLTELLEEDPKALQFYQNIELPYIEIIMELEQGTRIDVDNLEPMLKSTQDTLEGSLLKLQLEAGLLQGKDVNYSKKELFGFDKRDRPVYVGYTGSKLNKVYDHCELEPFNPNSGEHTARVLIDKWDWEPEVLTPSGKVKTSKDILEDLPFPFVADLLEYQRMSKLESTFLRPIMKKTDDNGILRASFRQFNTRTGRLSSADPNLQNIPAKQDTGGELRKLFVAPEGYKIICGDLEKIELVVLAWYLEYYCGDSSMADAVRSGEDIHDSNARAWGIERKPAKNTIFCLVYGGGAAKVAQTSGLSLDVCKGIFKKVRKTMPALFEFKEMLVKHAAKNEGVFHDWMGRRLVVPELFSHLSGEYASGERKVGNYIIQGTAGSIFKELQLRAYPIIKQHLGVCNLVVHDELVVSAPASEADELAAKLTDIFHCSDILQDGDVSLPIAADFFVADDWYTAKKMGEK